MFKLNQDQYIKVLPLIKSEIHLSVFSVIHGIMQGEIYVNNPEKPTAALIQTSECNLLAGDIQDGAFNSTIAEELDFWDPVLPDSEEWISKLPQIHQNPFVRQYSRCYYSLTPEEFVDTKKTLPEGFVVEKVDPQFIRSREFKYSEDILSSVEDWGGDKKFLKNGGGVYIRNEATIVSRALWDCTYKDRVEVGIKINDDTFKKMGFGTISVAETIKSCFERGYKTVGWHCVEANKGSRALAEKLGFKLICKYSAFSPYPPIENIADLTESEWKEWAEYFEAAAETEPRLWSECLFAYIKANNVAKAREVLEIHRRMKLYEHDYNGFVHYLHTLGMATNFSSDWAENLS